MSVLETDFLRWNQLLVNINQLFETSEKKKLFFFAQICISHTRVIHSYLQLGEERPQCIGCNSSFVIPNILLEYDDFSQVKKNISMLVTWNIYFKIYNVHIDCSMAFLKEINIF